MRNFLLSLMAALTVAAGLNSCEPRPDAAGLHPEPGFPIVLILIDALRADRVADGERTSAIAPGIAALTKDAVTFRNAFSSAPKTIPSVPQIFTSRTFPDIHHGTTLLSVCRDAGYQTGAFIHNPYVTKWLGRLDPTFGHMGGGELDAVQLTDASVDWLSSRTSDHLFLYMHYLDVHVPLKPSPEMARRFVDAAYQGPVGLEFSDLNGAWAGRYDAQDQLRIKQLYDASVATTDAQVNRLLQALRKDGLYDRALIIVTADHGEELWDHGGFFHGHSLYDELLRVPLIVKFPGSWAAGSEVEALVRSVDLLPTITDLLSRATAGAPPLTPFDGQSLVPVVTGQAPARTLFATVGRIDDRSPPLHAVRTATAKLITDMRTGEERLFDLTRDAAERNDRVADPGAAVLLRDLRRELQGPMQQLASTGVHVRLTNGTTSAIHYHLDIGLEPIAPFANLARFDMEKDDRIEQKPRATGLTVSGELAAGDSDELRFDVLASEGSITSSIVTKEGTPPMEVCVADEPACVVAADGRSSLQLSRLETAAAPSRAAAASFQATWWLVPGESRPIVPALSASDRERLRALGYAE